MKALLITVLMIFAGSASAGLYKWVDDEGNVHYSQKRPRDKQYKRLKAPAPVPENSKPLYPSTEKEFSQRGDTANKETAKNQKLRALNCSQAKKNLNAYQVYSRIRGEDGKIKDINKEEREKQIKLSQQAIRDFCD